MESGWIDPSRMLGFLKEGVPSRVLIGLTLGLILFAPDRLLDLLMLRVARERFGYWAGVGFALCVFSLSLSAISWAYSRFAAWRSEIDGQRKIRNRLDHLTADEKAVLQLYVNRDTHTQNFDLKNGCVAVLVRDGILFKATAEGFVNNWAFGIEPCVRQYLDDHRHLLDPPSDHGRPEEDKPPL
jgi:hypothetical protein